MPMLDIVVPDDVGDVGEVVVVTWLTRAGAAVAYDQAVVILQAEKVSFEVAAPAAGELTEILVQQGEVARRGQALARLQSAAAFAQSPATPDELPAPPENEPVREVRASPIAKRIAREHNVDLAQVTPSGESGRITEKDVEAYLSRRAAMPAPPLPAAPAEVVASPAAKRLAREKGIDLAQVTGSGEGGRISERDVLAHAERQPPAIPPPAMATRAPAVIPLAGMRGAIARRMVESLREAAQLTLVSEVDVTELVKRRAALKPQLDLSYTDLIVKAVALTLPDHPRLNAWLIDEQIQVQPAIHLGVAVALEDGLVVPVVRNADRQSLSELAREIQRLAQTARTNTLPPAQLSGSTFTITNLGMYGIDAFTPIINPPEVAILGVGRIDERLVRRDGDLLWRQVITLSLTIDHRAVDGAPGAAFLQALARRLEQPDWVRVGSME